MRVHTWRFDNPMKRSKLPTQKEIARLAKVSQVTVNAVLNGSDHTRTSLETRQRILAIAKRLNYRTQRHARLMRTGKSGIIALIGSNARMVESNYLRQNFAMLAIHDAGYYPKFYDINWYGGDPKRAWEEVLLDRPEGILISSGLGLITAELKSLVLETELPLVSMSGPQLEGVPLFIPDYAEGFYRLTRHVLGTGRRKISLVMQKPENYQKPLHWQDQRRQGFIKAMKEARCSPSVVELDVRHPEKPGSFFSIIRNEKLRDIWHEGYDFAKEQIVSGIKDEAWMFFGDAWAMGAMRAAGEEKVPVPEKIAITGCNGVSGTRYAYLPLTTLIQPNHALATEAVSMLTRMIKKGELRKNKVERLGCELCPGASTGNVMISLSSADK